MSSAVLIPFGGAAVLLLLLVCAVVLALVTDRNRMRRELADSRAEVTGLRHRLDEIVGEVEQVRARAAAVPAEHRAEYLITTAGAEEVPVSNRLVLSGTVGEPLVRLVALGQGVRRALSPEIRSRIVFEMRREVRRSRKQRRRDLKEARRAAHGAQQEQDAA